MSFVRQVAAGTGRNMEFYHSSCKQIVATDCSRPMLEVAEGKVKRGQEARWRFETVGVDELPDTLEAAAALSISLRIRWWRN